MGERTFVLPDLGEGLEEAVVSAWLVAEGDEVALNQPFVEIETVKATVEVPAPWAGRVVTLHAAAGASVAVGAALATFEVAWVAGGTAAAAAGPRRGTAAVTTPEVPSGAASPAALRGATRPPPATPAVRKLAKDLGVDLASVAGSGPDGRIARKDVELAAAEAAQPATAAGADEVPVSPIRRAIAQRLAEVAAIPQVTTFRTVDCSALDAFRREVGVSPLSVFVRALAEIVTEHRMLNSSWTERAIVVHRSVHVGIATDTERGLVVPVVRDADSRDIAGIATEIERLAAAARDGSLSPTDTAGATIAVTNTGSYGSEYGTPLLDPGHAVTIALGAIRPLALVVDGRVEARPACTLSCTFDHRVLDGATVGRALGDLVELLGSSERLEALPR